MIRKYRANSIVACFLLLGLSQIGVPAFGQTQPANQKFQGKKVLWVDSYHEGYEWSDGIEKGIRNKFKNSGVELKVFRMDTKRKMEDASKKAAGLAAKAVVDAFKPDAVIASDDNAQTYFVVPFLKNTSVPVTFCGVNWDASMYGYPCANITGMVEVEMAESLVAQLRKHGRGDRLGYLSGGNETDRKIAATYNQRFFAGQMKEFYAPTFAEYKEQFLRAQSEVDVLIIYNNGGVPDWDAAAAETFFRANTKIPTGSPLRWMAPYVAITMGIDPEEQGEYAASAALDIWGGKKPADIPVVENKKTKLVVNLKIAQAGGVVFPASMLRMAEVIGKE
jgi:hypothetical protein